MQSSKSIQKVQNQKSKRAMEKNKKNMYHLNIIFVIIFTLNIFTPCSSQINPADAYPGLFKDVQRAQIFKDQKSFVDFRPLYPVDTIQKKYRVERQTAGFNLKTFTGNHFDTLLLDTSLIFKHIDHVWSFLEKTHSKQQTRSSLIALPHPYIVPGGRFQEMYYWDSYFTMLGLQAAGKTEMIQNMVGNFTFLIKEYGHIPNGTRTYYLSRSQPPFFSLMVQLLAEIKGETVYKKYLPVLQQEYDYWMKGTDSLNDSYQGNQKVVQLNHVQEILNRYCDALNTPRPESYIHDVHTFNKSGHKKNIYNELRSGAESGWDYSSRWLSDTFSLTTIQTTHIIPVDLNCLIYNMEKTLEHAYRINKNKHRAEKMKNKAEQRKKLLLKYCWDDESGYFFDYNFSAREHTYRGSLAGVCPLYFDMVPDDIAKQVIHYIKEKFIYDGGVVTTRFNTGQQWDYPNGWAPLQWITYKACKNYKYDQLARMIAIRWTNLNVKVFFETGKMLEKYNVVNTHLPGGGGEYKLQDGFGWTNGVFLKLWKEERNPKFLQKF